MGILIKEKINIKTLDYIPRGVLMGRTGAGKTTLLNKICGTEYNAGAGKSSVTRNLFLNKNYVGGQSTWIPTAGHHSGRSCRS